MNWNWLDNDWNSNEPALRFATLFISPSLFSGGVLLGKLSVPTAKHLADFAHFFGESDIFFVVQRFCFPKNHKEYFESVGFSDGEPDIRLFFLVRQKTGNCDNLDYFHEEFINFLSEGIAVRFGQNLIIAIP